MQRSRWRWVMAASWFVLGISIALAVIDEPTYWIGSQDLTAALQLLLPLLAIGVLIVLLPAGLWLAVSIVPQFVVAGITFLYITFAESFALRDGRDLAAGDIIGIAMLACWASVLGAVVIGLLEKKGRTHPQALPT